MWPRRVALGVHQNEQIGYPLTLLVGSLSSDVFVRPTTTGSEVLSFIICLDAVKVVLLASFTLIETICSKMRANPLPKNAKKYTWRASQGGRGGEKMNISVLGVQHYAQFYPLRPFPECLASICAVINRETTILYNYPPKGRWIVVEKRDAKRRGIYLALFTDPDGDSCFSIN